MLTIGLSPVLLFSSPVIFINSIVRFLLQNLSFLKSLLGIELKLFKVFKKSKEGHTYTYMYIHIMVIPIIRNGEM